MNNEKDLEDLCEKICQYYGYNFLEDQEKDFINDAINLRKKNRKSSFR